MLKNFKRKALAALMFASPVAVFAEGENASLEVVTTQLTSLQTTIQQFVNAALPIIGAILGIVLLVSLFFVGYKLITRSTKKA